MVVLACFLWIFAGLERLALANNLAAEPPEAFVLFDKASPDDSLGILGEDIVEAGDSYQEYKVITFEEKEIILENQSDQEVLRLQVQGNVRPEAIKNARHLFIVKQLKKIHKAEMDYLHRFQESYAPNLEELIRQGLLPDSFANGMKQNYLFEVLEARKDFGKEPVFLVRASPAAEIQPDYFFSIGELGLIRYGDNPGDAATGPGWEYADHGAPESQYLGAAGSQE